LLRTLWASPSLAWPCVSQMCYFTGVSLIRSFIEGAFAPAAGRTEGALSPSPGGVCTEASRSCRALPLAFVEAAERMRDAELSA